jgi:hypothetical protein
MREWINPRLAGGVMRFVHAIKKGTESARDCAVALGDNRDAVRSGNWIRLNLPRFTAVSPGPR